jgi:hypothetical protein
MFVFICRKAHRLSGIFLCLDGDLAFSKLGVLVYLSINTIMVILSVFWRSNSALHIL